MSLLQKRVISRRFNKLSKNFDETLRTVKKIGKEPFLMPFWNEVNKDVERQLLPIPRKDFLNIRALRDTMFVQGDDNWLAKQLTYLKSNLKSKYVNYVKEDAIGSPLLLDKPNDKTSHNTIHHLYHIIFFLNKTKQKPSQMKTIIEWGGGYGNLAKLWKRHFNPSSTYIIIDTPLFIAIQWLYLSSVFPKKGVNIIYSAQDTVTEGTINLLPSSLMQKMKLNCDLFISTWGLSESTKEAQDYVVKEKWFEAKHLLIGFQDSTKELTYASRLGKIAEKNGAEIIDIEFIPNNHYAIK